MNLDNFREWLSDNLRYIILGAGVLIILTGLFFGIRAVGGLVKGDSSGQEQQETENNKGNDPSSPDNGEMNEKNGESADPLEENKDPDINTLVSTYYEALGSKDVDTLKTVVDSLDPAEESRIVNAKYIDGYQNVRVYTKKGISEGSYIVYAYYEYLCTGITTPVPALSQLYVNIGADGKMYISGNVESNSELSKFLEDDLQTADVRALCQQVDAEHTKAEQNDPKLAQFLQSLGTASSGDVIVMTVKEACNVRREANSDSEILGSLEAGDSVTRTGMEGDWIQVEYEGGTGYIFGELLQQAF